MNAAPRTGELQHALEWCLFKAAWNAIYRSHQTRSSEVRFNFFSFQDQFYRKYLRSVLAEYWYEGVAYYRCPACARIGGLCQTSRLCWHGLLDRSSGRT